jgi:hypothetical protein
MPVVPRRAEDGQTTPAVDADVPSGVMDRRVVLTAQQHKIVERRSAAVGPVPDMMGVAPSVRAITARESAVAISRHQSGSHRPGHGAFGSPHVERA